MLRLDYNKVFAVPGAKRAIDCVAYREDGTPISMINHLTLEELRTRDNNPAIVIMGFDQLLGDIESDYLNQAPTKIDEEKFCEMLEILPPVRWHRYRSEESFQMSEHTNGRITEAFIRLGDDYVRMYCVAGTSHGDLAARAAIFLRNLEH